MNRISKASLLASAVCVFIAPAFSPPAFSQGNTITIIRDDGTKDVIDMGGGAPETVPAPRAESVVRVPKVEDETNPARYIPPAARISAPEVAPASIADHAADLAPPPKPPVKKAAEKAVESPRKTADIAKPSRKPHRQILPVGEPITKDKALYIALGDAPPAREVQVFSIEDDQGLSYSVVFKTENSNYEVLVDGASGVILRSGVIEDGQAFVKPGHLPVR